MLIHNVCICAREHESLFWFGLKDDGLIYSCIHAYVFNLTVNAYHVKKNDQTPADHRRFSIK